MTHSDFGALGWAPPEYRPYLRLARVDRPVGVWLLYLPGLWGILLAHAPWFTTLRLALIFLFGSSIMRAAGCVVNDMWDRDIDRQVARTRARPLASGEMSMRSAGTFLVLLLAAAGAILLTLRPLCWAMGAASLVLVALYPLAKRVTWWPQLVMGFTFGFGAPMGYVAAGGALDPACALLYGAAILWDLGFDTIYGFQDIEDDSLIGVKSTSRRFAHAPRLFLACCYLGAFVCLAYAGHARGAGLWFWPALVPVAGLLAEQVRRLDPRDPALCLELFKLNRETGVAICAALIAAHL